LHTALTHLLGTTAILTVMSILIFAIYRVGTLQSVDISKRQLQEITDYVAQNFYDMIQTAVNFSSPNTIIIKELNIPISVGGNGYTISLSNASGSLKVMAWVDTEPLIAAQSLLPVNGTGIKIRINVNEGSDLGGAIVRAPLHSGSSIPVAFVQTDGEKVVIGLGTKKG